MIRFYGPLDMMLLIGLISAAAIVKSNPSKWRSGACGRGTGKLPALRGYPSIYRTENALFCAEDQGREKLPC